MRARVPPLTAPGCSTESPSRDTVDKHKMSLEPQRDPLAGEMQSLSVDSLPIGCLGPTRSALD